MRVKTLLWNIEGLANPNTQSILRNILRVNKHKLVFITELMIVYSNVHVRFFHSFKFAYNV